MAEVTDGLRLRSRPATIPSESNVQAGAERNDARHPALDDAVILPVVVEQVVQPAGDDDAGVAAEPHHCVNTATNGWDEACDEKEREREREGGGGGGVSSNAGPSNGGEFLKSCPTRSVCRLARPAPPTTAAWTAASRRELNFTVADTTLS